MKQNPIIFCGRGHSGTRLLAHMAIKNGIDLGRVNSVLDSIDWSDVLVARFNHRHGQPFDRCKSGAVVDEQTFATMANDLASQQNPLWGWKLGESLFYRDDILAVFPDAKFVNIIRDGRDVIMSGIWGEFFTSQKLVHEYKGYTDVMAWAGSWIKHVELARSLESDRFLNVYYEQLCQSPDKIVKQIRDFLGIHFHHFGLANTLRIGKWKLEKRAEFLEAFDLMAGTIATLPQATTVKLL